MSRLNALLGLTVAWLLSGCAALHERGEVAWQTIHAIDTVQTFHLTRDPRYKEVESAWLIGDYPKQKTVLAWSVGLSLVHASITQLLIDNNFPKISQVWQYMTLSSACGAVGQNAAIGIRIGGPNTGLDPQWRSVNDWSSTYRGAPAR